MRPSLPIALPVLLSIATFAATPFARAAEVTIYRCTDAGGKLTLRDTPCVKGQRQEVRSMIRPKDAPPRAAVAPATPVAIEPTQQRVVFRNSPRPLYECVRPDGSNYTSDTGDGSPRWVPLWTLDYPVGPRSMMLGDRIGAPAPRPPRDGPGAPQPLPARPSRGLIDQGLFYPGAGAGTWVRDECYALPQAEVCARLVDRRDEIRRRFFNAMPTERATLNVEERGINARLADDCGAY